MKNPLLHPEDIAKITAGNYNFFFMDLQGAIYSTLLERSRK